jgi:hypothetical protein
MAGSVHVGGNGSWMPLRLVREFVEATKDWPDDNWVQAGVVGLEQRMSIEYTTLQGLRAVRK